MEIKAIREGNLLKPYTNHDQDKVAKLNEGEMMLVNIKQPRSPKLHNLYFLILNKVFENQEFFKSQYHLRKFLEMAAGHYEKAYLPNRKTGEIIEQFWPATIAYHALDHEQFKALFDAVLIEINRNFDFDRQTLIDEALNS